MYVLADVERSGVVLGFIKTGEKKLFLHNMQGKMKEHYPTCLLDFYVHESCQRTGFGKELFEHVLQAENIKPHRLAVDRPSAKCVKFLSRHYKLSDYREQSNNYVVFRYHTALSHQAQPFAYILHGAYYMKDRDTRP